MTRTTRTPSSAPSRCPSREGTYAARVRQAYRILNYLLSLEVVIQAAVIAWYAFGVVKYADDHGSITHKKLGPPRPAVG